MDWMLVAKIVVTIVLATTTIGLFWVVQDSINSYEDDPTV